MASKAYSEQLGKNRHGDKAPARPRWYQEMASNIHVAPRPRRCCCNTVIPILWTGGVLSVSEVTLGSSCDGEWCWRTKATQRALVPGLDPALSPVVPSCCPQIRRRPAEGTTRAGVARLEPASIRVAGDEHGCVPRPTRCAWASKTPPGRHLRPGRALPARTSTILVRPDWSGTGQNRRDEGCDRSRRQTGATLGASRLQDGTTTLGLHPLAKSVLFRTTTLIGLKCTFHASLLTSLSRRLEATP